MRPPIWDLFLSISCTFYLKTGCAPPHLWQNSAPPFGKSWIRHWQWLFSSHTDESRMCAVLDKSLFWKSTLFDLTTEIWNNYLTWELKSAMKNFLISTYIDVANFLFCRNQTTGWKKTSRKCKGLIASRDLKLNLSKISFCSFWLIISVFHWPISTRNIHQTQYISALTTLHNIHFHIQSVFWLIYFQPSIDKLQ